MQLEELQPLLVEFCRAQVDDPEARVEGLEVLPGHAGFSYGFRLEYERDGTAVEERLVLRLAPPGVRYVGPADVVRQARVLRALEGTSVPVAHVSWAGDDPRWFGRPYTVVERLPGRTLNLLTDGAAAGGRSAEALRSMGEQAVRALAALHALDWEARLPEWGPPQESAQAVLHWDFLIPRAADPALVATAPDLRGRLLATAPEKARVGITHGDYQWSNLLFDGGTLRAVIDWELAGIGSILKDLGWLMAFSDRESWAPELRWPIELPSPEWLAERYAASSGAWPEQIAWHRALAGYAFGLIAAFNLGLHRRGRRVDPHYEELASSIPHLLSRAGEVLRGA